MANAKASDVVGDSTKATNQTTDTKNTKPTPIPELFYSPDYQQLFNKEIEEITLELLETAELILSNYNYKTIDYLGESRPLLSYNEFGKLLSSTEVEDTQLTSSQINPAVADRNYNVLETTVSPLKDSIVLKPGANYKNIISNYGYHTDAPDIVKYKPGYRSTGEPYYDLEISVSDVDGVLGYNIYMIEETD